MSCRMHHGIADCASLLIRRACNSCYRFDLTASRWDCIISTFSTRRPYAAFRAMPVAETVAVGDVFADPSLGTKGP